MSYAATDPHIRPGRSAKEIRARHPRARVGLIRAREDMGMTRPELGEKIGLCRSSVFKHEIGQSTPSIEHMVKWVEALGPGAGLDLFRIPQD